MGKNVRPQHPETELLRSGFGLNCELNVKIIQTTHFKTLQHNKCTLTIEELAVIDSYNVMISTSTLLLCFNLIIIT